MSRKLKQALFVTLPIAVLAIGWPSPVSAQARGRVATRVVVRGGPYIYGPSFYSPFWDPWFGPQWGYPYPYGWYPVGPVESSLRVDVKPRDAQVYVDGYYAGIVDDFNGVLQRLHVVPGQHEIIIYKEGYRSHRVRLYLGPNGSRKITHDLVPLAAGEPDEPLPQPTEPAAGPEGSDRIGPPRVPGRFPPPRRTPDPSRGSRDSALGSIAIRVQPEGAAILIDGETWTGGADDERLVVQLVEGTHRIEVESPGYQRVVLDVDVRRGETTPVNISLMRD